MRNEIQIIDLPALHAPIQKELDQAIQNVLSHQQFINGPEVTLFEEELGGYLNAQVVGVANGTDALEIALLTLGVGLGDEVLVPSFSYFASAEVIVRVGATPVFVDVDDSFTIDCSDAQTKVTEKTKAVIAVHLYGVCADMMEIMSFADVNGLKVIEDTAQALGAECRIKGGLKKAGTIGDIGCISFFPSKNLGAFGDAGAIISADASILSSARKIAQHGQIKKYHHDGIGMNSRLDTLQAAILHVKLHHLDKWTSRRQEIANLYIKGFSKSERIIIQRIPEDSTHVYHQFTILIEGDRESIMKDLINEGVPVRLYYPKAIHQQNAFSGVAAKTLEKTNHFQSQMISLPIHPTLSIDQIEWVINKVVSAMEV